jgi:bacillopeptidase F
LCGFLLPLSGFAQIPSEKISPSLRERMTAAPDEYQEVIFQLSDQEDSGAMLEYFEANKTPLRTRTYEVITRLQAKAAATQPVVISRLQQLDGVAAASIYPVWIVNSIFVRAKAAAIEQMAEWPEAGMLSWNAPAELEAFVGRGKTPPVPNGKEPGLSAIKANFMWNLGYTGYGRKALIIDTGDDGEHPALIANFWGNQAPVEQAWHGSGYPEDCADHGTHVTGTVCGLDRKTNDTIGVAFNAHWMGGPMQFPIGNALGCEVAFTQTIYSETVTMQWAINPDGDVNTISDQPDVINCSWRSGNFDCGTSVNLLNSVEAAGIGVVWAQGNEGPAASTVTSGASMNMGLVNTFAVGAVNGSNAAFPIAGFSSRGPTPCSGSGSLKIKPEVCAPGVAVRSSVSGGSYEAFDGTSMAAPHASGALVLLREAFPELSGIELKTALYNTATDLGVAGEDNAHGMGMINLEAAFNYLVDQGNTPVPPVPVERDVIVIDTKVKGICKGPVVATITFENASQQTINSLQILYGIENGTQLTYDWAGQLLPNTFTTVELPAIDGITPGTYVFVAELANPNGMSDSRPLNNRFKRQLIMADEDYPTASVTPQQTLPVCNGSKVLLQYTGTLESQEKVQWFINELGNPLAEGGSYLTPPLTQNTTYYVNTAEEFNTGKPELPPNTNSASINGALVFDVEKPFTLKSVKIYTEETGGRLIKLLDNAGNQVAFKLVSITQTGGQKIILNFKIPVGEDYQLTVASGEPIKQTSNQPGYPYKVPGVLNIYAGKTSSGFPTTAIYYYFFDWEIEVPQVCGRIPVPIQVSALTAPAVSFGVSEDTVYISNGGAVSFTDQTTGAVSWHWDFGNGLFSMEQNPGTVYAQPGTYKVRMIAAVADGCSNIAEKTIVVLQTVSANEVQTAPEKVSLYPNPATGQLFVEFSDPIPNDLQVSVFDMLGRNFRLPNNPVSGTEVMQFDISTLPPGVYIVQLSSNGLFWWSGKFVKK